MNTLLAPSVDETLIAQEQQHQEQQWIQAAAQGDEAAMSHLYSTYYPKVLRTISLGISSQGNSHVEELTQDVMVNVLVGAFHRVHEKGGFQRGIGLYFKTAAYNRLADRYRKLRIRQESEFDELSSSSVAIIERQPTTEDIAVHKSQLDYVIEVLKPHVGEASTQALLAQAMGQSYQEIAVAQGIPINTVRARVRRTRMTLRHLCKLGVIEAPPDATFNLREA